MTGKQLRNSILQWAIQGKLVPQDPNDEPASVLLERIRAEKTRLVKEKKIKKDKNESIILRGEDNSYYEKMADGTVRCIDSEIPFDIPESWEWVRLGSIFNHTSGKQQSSSNKCGGTPQRFITTSNLYWGRFVLDNVKIMNFTDDEIKTCSATKGDLLVCEGGAGYGRSAIWCYDYDICLQNHVHRLRPYVNGTCEYVYHFIYFLKETNQLAAVGTAMPGLSANRLKGLLMPLPPINEQQRIVAKLLNLEDYIHHYTAMDIELSNLNNDVNSKIYKSILQEAIQGRLVPQIESEGTAEELLDEIRAEKKRLVKEGKLKKSVLANESRIFRGEDNRYYEQIGESTVDITEELPFEIPENWVWGRLGTIANLHIGKTPPRGEPIFWSNGKWPWVSISDIRDSEILTETKEKVSEEAAARIFKGNFSPKGSLIMSFKLTIGKVATLGIDAFHNEAIITIRPYSDSEIFLQYLKRVMPIFAQMGDSKDAIKGKTLNSTSLSNLYIPIPPSQEQRRIEQKISALFHMMK